MVLPPLPISGSDGGIFFPSSFPVFGWRRRSAFTASLCPTSFGPAVLPLFSTKVPPRFLRASVGRRGPAGALVVPFRFPILTHSPRNQTVAFCVGHGAQRFSLAICSFAGLTRRVFLSPFAGLPERASVPDSESRPLTHLYPFFFPVRLPGDLLTGSLREWSLLPPPFEFFFAVV